MSFESGTATGKDILRWHGMDRDSVMAVAQDFIDGSVVLADTPVTYGCDYEINGDQVAIRTVDSLDNRTLIRGMSTADFIGGVAFALVSKGVIDFASATTTNVSRVCFAVGQLTAQQNRTESING